MSVTRIAPRYAKSLIELAVEQDKLEKIQQDILSFQEVLKQKDFVLMIKSPIIKADKKGSVIKALFGDKYDKLTLAFFDILLKKGREEFIPEIAKEFLDQYKEIKHITTVTLISATELSKEVLASIREKLLKSNLTDKKIDLQIKVDPKLIGGFVIEFDEKVYDASVMHQLEKMKKGFQNNDFVSQYVAR